MSRPKKSDAKVSKEQTEKLPDADGSDILSEEVSPVATKPKVFLGYHPITGAEVYAE